MHATFHAAPGTKISLEHGETARWLTLAHPSEYGGANISIMAGDTVVDRLNFVKALADAAQAWYVQLLDHQTEADLARLGLVSSPAGE
jgi:hypothetical protein